MPSLSLLIPDPALRGALSEQLQKAGFGDVREGADETVLTDTADQYLILDEEAADKKILKILRETHNKKRIFFLGVLKNEGDENLITETFEKPLRLGHLLARLQFYVQTASFTAGAITFG
ncbi:MAG: hypothetical protein WAO98_07530, partial [Alphaproteobacteria bacterium]